MERNIFNAIVEGNTSVVLNINAAALKAVVTAMVHDERKHIEEALEKSREKPTLSRHEVAKILNVSIPTIDRWTKTGYLPYYKVGYKVRFKPSDIDEMLKDKCAKN